MCTIKMRREQMKSSRPSGTADPVKPPFRERCKELHHTAVGSTHLGEEGKGGVVNGERVQELPVVPQALPHGGVHLRHGKEMGRIATVFHLLPRREKEKDSGLSEQPTDSCICHSRRNVQPQPGAKSLRSVSTVIMR